MGRHRHHRAVRLSSSADTERSWLPDARSKGRYLAVRDFLRAIGGPRVNLPDGQASRDGKPRVFEAHGSVALSPRCSWPMPRPAFRLDRGLDRWLTALTNLFNQSYLACRRDACGSLF